MAYFGDCQEVPGYLAACTGPALSCPHRGCRDHGEGVAPHILKAAAQRSSEHSFKEAPTSTTNASTLSFLSAGLLKKLNTDGFILGGLVFQAGLGDVIGMSRPEPQSWKGREVVHRLAGALGWGQRAPTLPGGTMGPVSAWPLGGGGRPDGATLGPGLQEERGRLRMEAVSGQDLWLAVAPVQLHTCSLLPWALVCYCMCLLCARHQAGPGGLRAETCLPSPPPGVGAQQTLASLPTTSPKACSEEHAKAGRLTGNSYEQTIQLVSLRRDFSEPLTRYVPRAPGWGALP